MDWDDAVGISMPLYTLVDVLFELQSRGFFRRQARPQADRRRPVSWKLCGLQGRLACPDGPHVLALPAWAGQMDCQGRVEALAASLLVLMLLLFVVSDE